MARAEEEPFQVYAIAATRGWKPEMIHAARLTLRLSFSAGMYIPEMAGMSLQDYVRLQRYHEKCRAVCGQRLIKPIVDGHQVSLGYNMWTLTLLFTLFIFLSNVTLLTIG